MNLLLEVIMQIYSGHSLSSKYQLHSLVGQYSNSFECHIKPNWLLIFRLVENELILIRTGTHSDLFK